MVTQQPQTTVDSRYSSPGATPTPWVEASDELAKAEIFWLVTVRPDGRPHAAPLLAVWLEGALYFCTGAEERKAKNLGLNEHGILMTECNSLAEELDVVVEGEARWVRDAALLQELADLYAKKYPGWHFTVRNGAFFNEDGGEALVYEVEPTTAFGFGRGETYSQTRWQF